MVDGSHAVGSLPLDIPSLGADMYAANLHKWLCTPKGTALLWVHPMQQHWVAPAVTSHGYETGFQGSFLWQGTRDDTAWCAVSAGVRVFEALGPSRVRLHNYELLVQAVQLLEEAFGPRQRFGLAPPPACVAMVTVDLPPLPDVPPSPEAAASLHQRLRGSYGVELPVVRVCDCEKGGKEVGKRVSTVITGVLAAAAVGAAVGTVLQLVGRVCTVGGRAACSRCRRATEWRRSGARRDGWQRGGWRRRGGGG